MLRCLLLHMKRKISSWPNCYRNLFTAFYLFDDEEIDCSNCIFVVN